MEHVPAEQSAVEVATSRSYEMHGVGQQLYAVIESCTSLDTLWAKIDSGHWDWLGVQERKGKRTFILGRPRVGRSEIMAALSGTHAGAEAGQHGVEVRTPHAHYRGVTALWHTTPEEAEAEYDEQINTLSAAGPGSALYRVTLVVNGQAVRSHVVARILPNRL